MYENSSTRFRNWIYRIRDLSVYTLTIFERMEERRIPGYTLQERISQVKEGI